MRVLLLLLLPIAQAADSQKRPTDDQRGKELYERHCVSCHGAKNRGDGPATSALVVKVPDLAGKIKADPDTIKLVQLGRGPMPAFEASFDADDTKRLLGWMAKVHSAPAAAAAAPAPAEPDGPSDVQGGDAQGGDVQGGDGPAGEGPEQD
jgi:mono/diheme cytochrome c family protein